jgi:hypothetical protein
MTWRPAIKSAKFFPATSIPQHRGLIEAEARPSFLAPVGVENRTRGAIGYWVGIKKGRGRQPEASIYHGSDNELSSL